MRFEMFEGPCRKTSRVRLTIDDRVEVYTDTRYFHTRCIWFDYNNETEYRSVKSAKLQ